ncbi:hypothetical protein L2634_09870 [Acinetobacter baumannii]|uniref:DNA-binding protein n=2 Tax=Acinetobacter calcoaceticus/baumannii complex TaxID=909768 RepID=A0A854N503_ACIBA|nr:MULTISPECIES: hypothetical protein [Acinetobacter]EXG34855.1 hypothetical protein J717_2126 [Acinetobacter baumannii 121738]UKM17096.1 hypothetical protein [Acinetobacter phage 4316]ATI38267.1 hypothetical protein BS103_06570 [Acinetobacter baumannii]EEX00772.1 hypothetical protein HMPREF0014_00736 [Acinetobacter sp. RUH 2624]EHU1404049.1 hypothetical protein [Acinetobacter baumannii]
MGKYIVVVESEKPPQIFIHDDVPNIGKVLEIKAEEIPNRVTAAWLMERYSLSRKTIVDELRAHNLGTNGKHLYNPATVMPILDNLNKAKAQRQARRKN